MSTFIAIDSGTNVWDGKTHKTKLFVVNTKGAYPIRLGIIRWWPAWRKYAFWPGTNTLFEEVCLREIADFCEQTTKEHKQK